jgi:hypothetical protein
MGAVMAITAIAVIGAAGQNGTSATALLRPGAAESAHSAARVTRPETPIKHIVVLDLENRSFDNVLGFWCKKEPGRCPAGGMPRRVKLSNGAAVRPTVDPDIVPNVVHTVKGQALAMNHGKMNGWDKIEGCHPDQSYACISGYEPRQEPNIISLANHFAISDRTFSMKDSPSWGGHIYVVAASLDGFTGMIPWREPGTPNGPGWGCDSGMTTEWLDPATHRIKDAPSCIPDPSLKLPNGGAYKPTPVPYEPTIMDRLNSAGLSWKIYGGKRGQRGYEWSICATFAECLYTRQDANLVMDKQVFADAKAGALPSFSVITPGGAYAGDSCHNFASNIACDNFVGQVASALMKGPEWHSTALFITWDDCGCFYDQVPPGRNPDGTQQGPRLPLMIVSPYAKPGYTDDTRVTFEGILAFVERTFNLAPLGVNDAQAYPFSNSFNYSQKPLQPVRMVHRALPVGEHIDLAELQDPS